MSSDRARNSYDASRRYRTVVPQQGRVTLEADGNEAAMIAEETLLAETLDIVGPCGTPDDGFKVGAAKAVPNFTVGAGTMYVGGLRVTQDKAVESNAQAEWLDHTGDPLWTDPAADAKADEFVYLFLREQEVCAVEDQPLLEVALGGPDTAARSRLVQRIVRGPAGGAQCATALANTEAHWKKLGLTFDPKTMRLVSAASLKVKFVKPPVAETKCDPQVLGGYLGADNQMIRVQISAHDGKISKLVWGYNNAAFLHRVTAQGATTLNFPVAPIDSYHAPRANHAVEILRSAVDLKENNYVAAHSGIVMTPVQAYDAGKNLLTLPSVLPSSYTKAAGQLFLRLWEDEVEFTPGKPVDLAGTGLQVTIDLPAPSGALTVGQFWTFAARPSTPVQVYPQRYLDAAQPPEGPRMWACPLAVIGWDSKGFELIGDCREVFDNLVELTKRHSECCSMVIKPADVAGGANLQGFLDSFAGQKATVSLLPGTYALPQPLHLTAKHSGLTLEGCHDGVILRAKEGAEQKFLNGLVLLTDSENVVLRRLRFNMPLHRTADKAPGFAIQPLIFGARLDSETEARNEQKIRGILAKGTDGSPKSAPAPVYYTSIGVRAVRTANLQVADCLFHFNKTANAVISASGLRVAGLTTGLSVLNNRFRGPGNPPDNVYSSFGIMAGLEFASKGGAAAKRTDDGALVPLVEDAVITGNDFEDLTLALAMRGEIGRIRCENNRANACAGGFYFITTDQQWTRERLLQAAEQSPQSDDAMTYYNTVQYSAQVGAAEAMIDFARATPLPDDSERGRWVRVGQSPSTAHTKELRAKALAMSDRYQSRLADKKDAKKAPAAGTDKAGTEKAATEQKASSKVDAALLEDIRARTAGMMVTPVTWQEPATVPAHLPAIRFAGNEVKTLPIAAGQAHNFTIVYFGLYVAISMTGNTSVMVSANDIRGDTPGPVAEIDFPGLAVINGNLFLNASSGYRVQSLVVNTYDGTQDIGLVSLTGNVLVGEYFIDEPPDLGCAIERWQQLNSQRPI